MSLWLHHRRAACLAVGVLVLIAAGCGGQVGASGVRVVKVTERDFAIKAPHVLRAGTIRFVVTNNGPVSHELILVHAPQGRLPLRGDGFTVDETVLESRIVGTLEPAGPGTTRSLQVRLAPGRYVLLCNMAGHFMGGMSSRLLVR
jgi:uncharacterized cupredoxin-like copper-binding protein